MLLNRDRALAIMERENLDALIAVTPNNVVYLSDYDTDFLYDVPWLACAILPRSPDIEPCLITTEIEAAVLYERPTWMPDVRLYYFGIYGGVLKVHTFAEDAQLTEDEAAIHGMVQGLESQPYVGLMDAVQQALKEKGLTGARLGLDDTRFAGALGDTLDQADVVDATNLLIEIRMVKSPAEIDILRAAARKNENAMRKAFAAIHEGATWQEVYTAYEVGVAEQGGRVLATFNGAGRKSAGAGRPDRDYPINRGDQVCFDSMMKWRRYMGDAQRTGPPTTPVFRRPTAPCAPARARGICAISASTWSKGMAAPVSSWPSCTVSAWTTSKCPSSPAARSATSPSRRTWCSTWTWSCMKSAGAACSSKKRCALPLMAPSGCMGWSET